MAEIVLGLGTSHTPMLLVHPEDLVRYEENDRRIALLDTEGESVTFDALLAAAPAALAAEVAPERLIGRHQAARAAISHIADALASAALDALIVIGDDQKEMFTSENIPALLVYWGESLRSERPPHAPGRPAWVLRGSDRYYPADGPREYPVARDLARYIVAHLVADGFDVAAAERQGEAQGMGHAYAFVCTQLMLAAPVPLVPVFLNALYPPNQPTPARCLTIGKAIARAVAAAPGGARVGIVASGGLSHFVVDEALDRTVIAALAARDHRTLAALPARKLNSGNAEIRNWICAAGALAGLELDWVEYLPGYRTRAGTGTGLCFAVWR